MVEKMKKNILLLFLVLITVVSIVACNKKAVNETVTETTTVLETEKETEKPVETVKETVNEAKKDAEGIMSNNVEISIKDYGKITLELEPDAAPKTVENFVKLVNRGFYNGLTFHRIIKDFMIQGGDPLGNGTGGSEENIEGEFSNNGVANNISHKRGVISMARSMDPNSASSQFFIVHKDSEFLDGNYAAFGNVTSGIEVVDKICDSVKVEDDNGTVARENQPIIEYIKMID